MPEAMPIKNQSHGKLPVCNKWHSLCAYVSRTNLKKSAELTPELCCRGEKNTLEKVFTFWGPKNNRRLSCVYFISLALRISYFRVTKGMCVISVTYNS